MVMTFKASRGASKSTGRAKAATPWYKRPVLAVLAAGLGLATAAALGAEGFRVYAGGDPGPKRWKTIVEDATPCYNDLTTQPPPKEDCVHNEKAPITARYHDWIHPHVAVYSAPAPPRSPPTMRDLGDQGQAAAISFLEKDSGLRGKAWADLQDALNDSDPGVGKRDPFHFDRILIANVAKGIDWKPGDRMTWTRLLVQPINFSFAGYSVAATDNEAQKVTSVERTDSRKFSADISATIPGLEGPKASLGPSSEHTVKTSSDITAQYEKLGIDIMPDFLRIIRESETGGDALGNTKVSLTAVTDPEMIWRAYPYDLTHHLSSDDPIVLLVTGTHFDGDGMDERSTGTDRPRPAVDILPQVPVPHCALRARVWMIYEERRVDSGREYYDESKQAVTLKHDAEDKQDVDIMSADEVSPAVWSLKLCENPRCTGDDVHLLKAVAQPNLSGRPNGSLSRKVVFTDYGVAIRLAHWLRTHPKSAPPNIDYRFNYPDESDRTYVTLVPVKATGDECRPERPQELTSR